MSCNDKMLKTQILLLTEEEYKKYYHFIPKVDARWWLMPKDCVYNLTPIVCRDGSVNEEYHISSVCGVRPLIVLSENIDLFEMTAFTWTRLNKNLFLCDQIVFFSHFRKEFTSNGANHWEESDVKQELEKWWAGCCFSFSKQKNNKRTENNKRGGVL